jgi:hypothetical protein
MEGLMDTNEHEQNIRDLITIFSTEQEEILLLPKNLIKGQWVDEKNSYLEQELNLKLYQYHNGLTDKDDRKKKLVDIANFAMMLWDNIDNEVGD